jgi:nitrite reductase/ring-hydroxylating ferredoxin subunit
MTDAAWWSLARSEEVTGKKPLAADIGDQPVVLWRDAQGTARALEDRCPHRRAPLSLGCVRDNGLLQCGYHGWSYDGATGRLVEIPNMKSEQRFPPHYKAQRFGVAESGGFVRVCLEAEAAAPRTAEIELPHGGTSFVGLAHDQYVAAMFDAPGLLIGIRGVAFTPYLMSELHDEAGTLVMERSCQWKGMHRPSPFSSDFPATVVTRTHPVTGETLLTLRATDLSVLLTAIIAPVPAARGVTAVRWRYAIGNAAHGVHAQLLRLPHAFRVFDQVDAAALRAVHPSASLHGAELRTAMTVPLHDAA